MKRPALSLLLVIALAVAAALAWKTLERDREYRRLIAAGETALSADQTLDAIEAFSGAIALRDDSMLAWLRRGEAYRRQGDLAAAVRDLRTAATLDPMATRPLEQLGDAYYAQQRYGWAAERYAAYVRLDDESPRLLYKLALARYQDGQIQGAIVALRRAVQLDDRLAEAYYLLGLSLRRTQQLKEAVATLQRAVRLAPALAPPREALAEIFGALGRHRERIAQLEALAALESDAQSDRFVALGLAHADAGRTDLAVVAIGRAAERDPDDPKVYSALASVWLRLADRGDHGALVKALEASRVAAATGSPGSHDLLLYGRALLLSDRTEEAVDVLRDATRVLPVDPAAFTELADAAERLGRHAEARNALMQHLALVDDDRRIVNGASRIADLSMRLNDPRSAVRWLSRATLLRSDPMLFARLAEAHLASGDAAAARQAVDRALALGISPSTPLIEKLSRLLISRRRPLEGRARLAARRQGN